MMPNEIEMRRHQPDARRARSHQRRWRAVGTVLLALPFLAGASYVGVYYLVYQLLPWQKSDGMAAVIMAAAQAQPSITAQAQPSITAQYGLAQPTPSTPAQQTPSPSPSPPQHGRMEQGKIPSTLLPGDRPFYVYLPPTYDADEQRYPVLYLLHGAPGKYADWYQAAGVDQTLDALIITGRLRPMIVVLPDGNGGPYSDTQWANSGDGKVRAEDYVVQELVPYMDAHYRTLATREQRAIGGLSTGAFGAINMTFHHPDLFGYAFGLSGNYLAGNTWTGQTIWADDAAKALNSPITYAPRVPNITTLHIYLGVAPTDNDADTLHQTQQFADVLAQLNVPHKVDYFAGGHNWTYWKTHIVDALEYLQQVMPQASSARHQ